MRLTATVAVVALLALGTAAWPGPTAQEHDVRLATAQFEKGHELLGSVFNEKTNAARLQLLDRAVYFLRSARSTASKQSPDLMAPLSGKVDDDLVSALDNEAEIYYVRKSLNLAKKRATEALSIQPGESRAAGLLRRIREAESTDVYEGSNGIAAIQRIRDRRAAAGIPLRDRGVSTRR